MIQTRIVFAARLVAAITGAPIQLFGLRIILRYAMALLVQKAEIELRINIALPRCKRIPLRSLCIVLRDTANIFIQHPKIEFGGCNILFFPGGSFKPLSGLGVVRLYTPGVLIQRAKFILRVGIAPFGFFPPLCGVLLCILRVQWHGKGEGKACRQKYPVNGVLPLGDEWSIASSSLSPCCMRAN